MPATHICLAPSIPLHLLGGSGTHAVLKRARRIPPLAALLLQAACEPCAGVSVCSAPRVDYEGDVRVHLTGTAARGVTVEFQRAGGVSLERDTLRAVTDSVGRFRLTSKASEEGVVTGRLLLVPAPPYQAYPFAVGVTMGTTRADGDVRFLGSWGVGPVPTTPRIHAAGELFFRGTGEPMAGVVVEFRQTGGVPVSPAFVASTSGADGIIHITAETIGGAVGDVVGSLTFSPPGAARTATVESVRFSTFTVKDAPQYLGRWGLGEGLLYQGELNWSDTYTHAPGIEVEFRRTGGIAVQPDTFVVATGADGRFHLRPRTIEAGEVVAELHVRHPNPAKSFVIPAVRLATREDDESRLLGVWTLERP